MFWCDINPYEVLLSDNKWAFLLDMTFFVSALKLADNLKKMYLPFKMYILFYFF